MNNTIQTVRQQLTEASDEKTRLSGLRFFREKVELYGVKSAVVVKIAKSNFEKIKGEPKGSIIAICEQLWQSGMLEESFVACNWSYALRKSFVEEDLLWMEQWVGQYLNNWASCDTLCNHTVGSYIEMFPDRISVMKIWATSPNRWMRRAAAVSLIIPARKGLFLKEVFEIADLLLLDPDDMVQKGYGWMLKVASQKHQQEVFDYVIAHKKVMPRTALCYAIEKMPKELKVLAMAKP